MNISGVKSYLVTMSFRLTQNDQQLTKILPDMCKSGVILPLFKSLLLYISHTV